MKALRIALGAAAVIGTVGCSVDTGPFRDSLPPRAFVRYLHAVPDTGAMDVRPIDAVENSPFALALTFRAFTPYQAMGAGPRRIRVFPTSEDPAITSQIVLDSTINFTEGKYYSVIYLGLARAGQAPADKFLVLEDAIPASIGTQVAVRMVNLLTNGGTVDVGTSAAVGDASSTSFATGLAYGAASQYQLVAPGARAFRVFATGTTTPTLANVLAPAGVAGDPAANLTTVGGTNQAGSAFTGFIVPASVTGSRAPQGGAFAGASLVYIIDKHPR